MEHVIVLCAGLVIYWSMAVMKGGGLLGAPTLEPLVVYKLHVLGFRDPWLFCIIHTCKHAKQRSVPVFAQYVGHVQWWIQDFAFGAYKFIGSRPLGGGAPNWIC